MLTFRRHCRSVNFSGRRSSQTYQLANPTLINSPVRAIHSFPFKVVAPQKMIPVVGRTAVIPIWMSHLVSTVRIVFNLTNLLSVYAREKVDKTPFRLTAKGLPFYARQLATRSRYHGSETEPGSAGWLYRVIGNVLFAVGLE